MPRPYVCTRCGASAVKLWRDYTEWDEITPLLCLECLCDRFQIAGHNILTTHFDARGRLFADYYYVGLYCAAIPTEEEKTGYYTLLFATPELTREWESLDNTPRLPMMA